LSLLEAMLCARASVATEAAGGGYLCLEDETGFTVNAPSANALGDALERAWAARDRWQALGEAAYALASRTVSKDPVGDFCGAILLAANGRAQV
jgi:glycosyltransferase involved in cell wall biosynthesis